MNSISNLLSNLYTRKDNYTTKVHHTKKISEKNQIDPPIIDGVHTDKDGVKLKSSPQSSKVPLTKS